MTLGMTPASEDFFDSATRLVQGRIGENSIYELLSREGHRLFPDEEFADLFNGVGRRSVPPQVVATVMVLQRLGGLSDREAVERFEFDVRWKYACGVPLVFPSFVHTVLVDMRERLRRSDRPNRIFEKSLGVAREAGLVGRRRVLDSTALYDAVATQDTVTLIRAAIRATLKSAGAELATELRGELKREDDYSSAGKPECDWDDAVAREALVDALARDAYAVLAALHDRKLDEKTAEAAQLLATVTGQDLEQSDEGRFRIARKVSEGRVISTVDPDARHGHKTSAHGFDGYKGHVAVDPDSEIITSTSVTAGNVADGKLASELLADVLPSAKTEDVADGHASEAAVPGSETTEPRAEVYGDASYGTAENIERLAQAGIANFCKVPSPSAREGKFSKEAFQIDLDAETVTCPAKRVVPLRASPEGGAVAQFVKYCQGCPLRDKCTNSKRGRTIRTHPKERQLREAREAQRHSGWRDQYRSTRPKVERKQAHMMRRRHGGRRARVRGRLKVGHDFALLAAATNLARLAKLGVRFGGGAWLR